MGCLCQTNIFCSEIGFIFSPEIEVLKPVVLVCRNLLLP